MKLEKKLEEAKILYQTANADQRYILESLFPELKESEDEKVKRILHSISSKMSFHLRDIFTDEEFQCFDAWSNAWLKKQGEQKETLCDKCKKEQPSHSCQDITELGRCAVEHEQKPADNVKPKFKVGDWITCEELSTAKIVNIDSDRYEVEFIDGCHSKSPHIDYIDRLFHLWTIADAKDGDVIVCNINKAEIGGDIEKLPNITPTICVYQNVVKDKGYIHTYCSLYNGSSLVLSNSMYYNTFVYNIHPATKEQCDHLFQEIRKAGYEWDEDNKELKKFIIDGILTATNYDKMFQNCNVSNFNVGVWVVNNISKDIFLIKSVNSGYCTLEDTKGNIYFPCLPFETEFHLWTLDDVKNGDVLVYKGNVKYSNEIKYERICLFNNLDKAFFTLTKYSNGIEEYNINVNIDYPDNTVPATKEQKEILFMAIKDVNYKWDAENKELKKIKKQGEQKSDS